MIRVRGLITSIKSNLLTSRNAFPHKVEDSWEQQFSKQNPKINYLGKLLQTNQIRPYFIEKDIKELEKQDIYFFMQNKEIFHSLPWHKKIELIKNPNANSILKFHLALQLYTLKNQQVQKHLLKSFNTSVKQLSAKDTLFCLELICNFTDAKQEINYYEVERKFSNEENPQLFLKGIYLLSKLEFRLEIVTNEMILERVTMMESFSIDTILQVKFLARFYQIELNDFCENRLRQSFNQKRRDFNQDQAEIIVQLLQFYPESANLINLQSMTALSYISYLDFFCQGQLSSLKQIVPKPIQHPIPQSILTNASKNQIYKILERRIQLDLDTPDKLIANIKAYFTPNLNLIVAIIKYLDVKEKMTPENQLLLEKAIFNKIIRFGVKVFEEFNIVDVFKILGYMSVNEFGTINFWKRVLKFVTCVIQDPQNYKNLSGNEQKRFVVYIFQIFKNKPFPRQLQDQIINLTLLSLTINSWTLRQIWPLTNSLNLNKIGDNQLWFGIEKRIMKQETRHLQSSLDRTTLKKIVNNFNTIGKGSYEFWSEVNKSLNKKEKIQILNGSKVPSTLAHTYLKV